MAAISLLNPKAEFARAAQALAVNISAAKGIQDVMKTNLGPKGTMKMWVVLIIIKKNDNLRVYYRTPIKFDFMSVNILHRIIITFRLLLF